MTASNQTTADCGTRRRLKISRIGQWSLEEWSAILAVAGILLFLKAMWAPSTAEKQQLREQFRLADDVTLTKVYTDRSSAKPFAASIEGFVQFTDLQFSTYVAKLDDASVWRPVPITHGGIEFFGPYDPGTLVWRDLRGARGLAWGSLSWKQVQDASNGRVLCISVRDDGAGGDKTTFRGQPCPPPNTPTVKAVYVQGLLDYDKKTLHMLIRQTRQTGR